MHGPLILVPPPAEIATLLEEAGIVTDRWTRIVGGFESLFHYAVGAVAQLNNFLERTGRRAMVALRTSRDAFT
jgi:hypothetical protein